MSILRHREEHYTPEDDVRSLLNGLPSKAKHSVDVEIYGFTDRNFMLELVAAAVRKIQVRIMADHSQSKGAVEKPLLHELVKASKGYPLTLKIVESTKGKIDHLKMVIIDALLGPSHNGSSVLKGSYNFSTEAQLQDNFVTWDNDPGIVHAAIQKFENDWKNNEQKPEWQIIADE